ncbi:hypothetical protein SLA2020_111270 [Shorea laevis]
MLPAADVYFIDGQTIVAYINSTRKPIATITPVKTILGTKPSPSIATFSSRGPNFIDPGILKPDITAPGVNILAAFSLAVSPTKSSFDKHRIPFNTLSGTSMSCPHASGVFGLLKTLYPLWSPAAIKSAIMTTARTRDNGEQPNEGLFNQQYGNSICVSVTRRVKNIGHPGTYSACIKSPAGVSVSVRPKTLTFKKTGEGKEFVITFNSTSKIESRDFVFGQLVWSDGKHNVRSPIVIKHK